MMSNSKSILARSLRWWLWVVVVAAIVASIGTPLLGLRVFWAADMLYLFSPWRDGAPHGFVPDNALVSDTVNGVMPMRAEFYERLRGGDFALWSDDSGGGVTLGAVPDLAVLSPLTMPYALLPDWYAPAVVKALEMAVAAGFTVLFLRRLGTGRLAALVGGLIYMNSGFQVAWTNWPQTLVGAFIPVLFWAVERAIQEWRAAALAPVAFATAGLLLGGFPAVAAFALLAAGAYALVRVLCLADRVAVRLARLVTLGVAVALGVGLAAVQLLPFAARLSYLELDYRDFSGRHLSVGSLLTAVVPWAQGAYVDGVYYGDKNVVETLSFIGATATVLMIMAAVWGHHLRLPRGARPALWGMLGVGVIITYFGGPLLTLFEQLMPFIFEANFIGRLRSVLCFLAAALAGLGVEVLSRSLRGFARADLVRAICVAAIVLVLAFAAVPAVVRAAEAAHQLRYLARHSVLPLLAAGVAVSIVVLVARSARRRPFVLGVLPILVVVEALAVVWPFWAEIPRSDFYPVTPVHTYLGDHVGQERVLLQGRTLVPGSTMYYGIRTVASHQFFQPTWKQSLQRIDPHAFGSPTHPTFARRTDEGEQIATSPLLDRLSASHYVAAPWAAVIGAAEPFDKPTSEAVLRGGGTLQLPAPTGELRALRVWVYGPYDRPARAQLRATVISPTGAQLTAGSRRVDDVDWVGNGILEIAVPQASVPPGSLVRLELDTFGGAIRLGAEPGGVVVRAVRTADDGLRTVFTDGAVVYERQRALPRFRWASVTRVVIDASERLDVLTGSVPADTVVLGASGQSVDGLPATVHVLSGDGDEFAVDVDAKGAGYLVVADGLQNGWTAMVDGRAQPLVAADHALVAVRLSEGTHRVVLRYEPRGWQAGRAVSGAAALVLVGLLGWRPRKRLTGRTPSFAGANAQHPRRADAEEPAPAGRVNSP